MPTVLIGGGVLYFHRPWQEQDWQRHLEQHLHVRAKLSEVSAPLPGERLLGQLQITDLQTNATLAKVEKLHLRGEHFECQQVEIPWGEAAQLKRVVQGWLATAEMRSVNLQIKQLQLTRPTGPPCELLNVNISLGVSRQQTRKLTVVAELPGRSAGEAQLRLEVDCNPQAHWIASLDCREGGLPAWIFAGFLPGAGRWNGAEFSGTLVVQGNESSPVGTLQGALAPLDLQAWLGSDSAHQLQATATLRFDTLRWEGSRIRETKGTLDSEPGQVSRSLLQALEKTLFCVPGKPLTEVSQEGPITFDRMGCHFSLSAAGLTATGTCPVADSDAPRCLLVADGKPLLLQPAYSSLPLPYFVQVFCPLEKYWLPATRAATEMAETLPLSEQEAHRK